MAQKQFQENCVTVFRPELLKNNEFERIRVSVKTKTLQVPALAMVETFTATR